VSGYWCRCEVVALRSMQKANRRQIRRLGREARRQARASWGWFAHGPGWFRIKGYGVRYVDHRRQQPLFSERNGYRTVVHVGPHCFRGLLP